MNLARNGKIARLPKVVREELNRRLDNGEQGGPLLTWLNSLPEVRALMGADFGGLPVNKHNLSQWRRRGYAEWLLQRESCAVAQQMIAQTGEFHPANAPPLTDRVAVWVTARYLLAVRNLSRKAGANAMDLKVLRGFCHDLVALRRGDHSRSRLQIQQERLQHEQQQTEHSTEYIPGSSAD